MANILVRMINRSIWFLNAVKHRLTRQRKDSPDYIQSERAKKWFADDGDNTLRLNYDLDENSIVFDIGGYKGDFASSMTNKYACTVYIFEPIPEFYSIIENRFLKNKKIKPYRFGLSGTNSFEKISMSDNGSSVYIDDANGVTIELKDAVDFILENNIANIDLVKINIEGSEYELLEKLIEKNMINRFKNIQVQFHDFIIENARERMENIQKSLAQTHELTYQYDFIWENWKLKE